jgi:peptide/nickel transport system substrate-binding protein
VDVNVAAVPDLALRRAILTAIDRDGARQHIHGDLLPPLRDHLIFPRLSPFFTDRLTATGFGSGDVAAARAILAQAGYTGYEAGTLTAPDGTVVPALRFVHLATNANRAAFVELARTDLAALGLTVAPTPTTAIDLGAVLSDGQFDLVIFGWGGGPLFTPRPSQFFRSDSGANFTRLADADIDRLVDLIPQQLDIADAAALTDQVVDRVLAEAAMLPLWDTLGFMFANDRVVNARDNLQTGLRAFSDPVAWGFRAD